MGEPMLGPEVIRALKSARPAEQLREAVAGLLERGRTRDEVTAELEQLRVFLRETGRQDEEDAVLDVLDFVSGWSSPHMKL